MPVYTVNPSDDLDRDQEYVNTEFTQGLASVLADVPENMFAQKRIAVLATAKGHVTFGRDYVKEVVDGLEVSRKELPTEAAWRRAVKERMGMDLGDVDEPKPKAEPKAKAAAKVNLDEMGPAPPAGFEWGGVY